MRRIPRGLVLAVTVSLSTLLGTLSGILPVTTSAAAREPAPLASTGYVLGGAPASPVAENAHGLATLGVAAVGITPDGRSVASPAPGTTSLVAVAHAHGLRAELLLSNYSDELGDFDPRAVRRLLTHPDRVRRVAGLMAGHVAAGGWDGVQVDLERMTRAQGAGLVQLVRELQSLMPAEKSVSIAVSASGTVRAYRDRGYRLGALGRAVDTVALMTYDQHGPTWSGPGPVGARDWQERCLEVALTKVPAATLDLGIAGYGYTWPVSGTGRTVTVKQARRLVADDGAEAVWRPGPGEWTATLSDGTVLWWSDARSYVVRERMARRAGLHGLALWRLGSADTIPD